MKAIYSILPFQKDTEIKHNADARRMKISRHHLQSQKVGNVPCFIAMQDAVLNVF